MIKKVTYYDHTCAPQRQPNNPFHFTNSRSEVPTLSAHPAPRHQAGQPAGEQQLRAEDMRLRAGSGRGAGHQQEHDAGGRHAVLQVRRQIARAV